MVASQLPFSLHYLLLVVSGRQVWPSMPLPWQLFPVSSSLLRTACLELKAATCLCFARGYRRASTCDPNRQIDRDAVEVYHASHRACRDSLAHGYHPAHHGDVEPGRVNRLVGHGNPYLGYGVFDLSPGIALSIVFDPEIGLCGQGDMNLRLVGRIAGLFGCHDRDIGSA